MCGYSGRSIRFKAYLGVQNHILFDRNRRKKIHRKLPYHSRNKEKKSCRSVEGGAQQDGGVGGDRPAAQVADGTFYPGEKSLFLPPRRWKNDLLGETRRALRYWMLTKILWRLFALGNPLYTMHVWHFLERGFRSSITFTTSAPWGCKARLPPGLNDLSPSRFW